MCHADLKKKKPKNLPLTSQVILKTNILVYIWNFKVAVQRHHEQIPELSASLGYHF